MSAGWVLTIAGSGPAVKPGVDRERLGVVVSEQGRGQSGPQGGERMVWSVSIRGKDVEVTEAIRAYILERLGPLDHYRPTVREVQVELELEKTRSPVERHVVKVTAIAAGQLFRAEERAADVRVAIDEAAAKLRERLGRVKEAEEAARQHHPPSRALASEPLAMALSPAPEIPPAIVQTTRALWKPMTLDEALDQMALLGKEVFLFLRAETGLPAVVHRLPTGGYGLIEPEIAQG